MSRLKIGICGAPGTGKTLLAKEISRALTLPLIYQGSRELMDITGSKSRPHIPRMNEVQRMQWQIDLIKYRLEKEFQTAEFVADGTALDLIVWYRMFSWLVPFEQKVDTEDLLYKAASQYDYIFYCPLWIELVAASMPKPDDPMYVDPFNLETSDYILKGVLSTMMHKGFRGHVLQKQQVDQRLDEVLSVVNPLYNVTEDPKIC